MVKLTFKLSAKVKPSREVNKTTNVFTDVEGVIVLIENTYYVCYNNKNYSITFASNKCKGKQIVYSRYKDKVGRYVKILRDLHSRCEMNNKLYLPYKEGLKVRGDVIVSISNNMFNIKQVIHKNNSLNYE